MTQSFRLPSDDEHGRSSPFLGQIDGIMTRYWQMRSRITEIYEDAVQNGVMSPEKAEVKKDEARRRLRDMTLETCEAALAVHVLVGGVVDRDIRMFLDDLRREQLDDCAKGPAPRE